MTGAGERPPQCDHGPQGDTWFDGYEDALFEQHVLAEVRALIDCQNWCNQTKVATQETRSKLFEVDGICGTARSACSEIQECCAGGRLTGTIRPSHSFYSGPLTLHTRHCKRRSVTSQGYFHQAHLKSQHWNIRSCVTLNYFKCCYSC